MAPLISVIMPVRNGKAWLRDAIESVLRQDFDDYEFLIVDDGSDDDTARILADFARRDSRICLLTQAPLGIVMALNRAIAAARAPYLARLDADDIAKPERLVRQFAFMQAHADIGLVGSWAEKIDGDGKVIGRLTPPTDAVRLTRSLGRANPFIHSSVMMRTELVRRMGGFRAAFRAAEDYDLWFRMAEVAGIANLPEYLIRYRWHGSNLSQVDAIRQSFSVRLAQRSAAGRRDGATDPASALAEPPDWWAADAATSFFADDVEFYRFLDAGRPGAAAYVSTVWRRLRALNHTERRLAQSRLLAMLREADAPFGPRKLTIIMLIALLHPARALSLARRRHAA
jgi:GT2 family glycosyltransferase